MESTESPVNATAPVIGQSLVEAIRTRRENAGVALAVLSLILLALTGYLAFKAYQSPGVADKDKTELNSDLDKLTPKGPTEIANLKQGDYNVGWVTALACFIITGLATLWLFASPPPLDEEKQRSEIRQAILVAGGLLGIVIIFAGLIYFYRWSDSLANWLEKGEEREARWTVISLMMAVLGAGLVFLAIQPARAEERNNSLIRKEVYGANFALTIMLLLVSLVVANVLVSLRVPNKLDTTATGFYSISETTRQLLDRLDQPVTAYGVLDRDEGLDRATNDIRQLLLACQDASNGKFKVKFLNSGSDKSELNNLRSKYPQLALVLDQRTVSGAILLTTGEDEKRHVVIPDNELFDERGQAFQGESRLYKEIVFLADSQTKPVIYFTQSNGELEISGAGGQPIRSASRLKQYLEKNYLDIRPLSLSGDKPEVPADATEVVIAEPRTPFADAAINALRKYMTNPAKKGKLIFLSGTIPGPDGKMLKTGIEPLLAELNVRLGEKYIYNLPVSQAAQSVGPENVLAGFSKAAEQNPILESISKVSQYMTFYRPREVEPMNSNPALQATDLLLAVGVTWLETERPTDLNAVMDELLKSRKLQEAKGLSENPRPVAAIVTEGQTGRAVVFGSSLFITDEYARRIRQGQSPLSFDMFGVTIDWLRDKSTSIAASGIESKKYVTYQFPPPASVDNTRLIWLPLGLGLVSILGLGAGVWVIRRK
jgi:hypothetical protein